MIALAGAALSLLPTAAVAQAQIVFGTPSNQVVSVPLLVPYTGYIPDSYPYTGFYHYYLLGEEVYNPNYEYSLSADLQYEFPVVGNFQYQ